MKPIKHINIQSIINSTSTNADGDILYDFLINNALKDQVILQLDGHLTLSSSFLNSSFGKYIDIFGLDNFKKNIKIKSNDHIFSQLKRYVQMYTSITSY